MIDEFIKPFKNPNNTRPRWVLLIILLCIYLFISYVDAWYFADRDGINGSELSGSPTSFLDSYHIRYYQGNYIGYATQYPTTDWTMYGTEWGGGTTWVSVRDINNNEFKYLPVDGAAGLRLINIKRVYSGGTYYYNTYVNGVYNNHFNAVGTIPYYLKFFYYKGNIKAYIFSYGENEEKNIILTHPSSYFLAKDIFNSEFTGLYSSPNNQVWPNKFYAYYISDTPNKNITIKNKNTNQIIYSAQTSGVCGLYEFNFTQIFINNNVSTGIYSIQMDGSTQSQDITYKAIATSGTSIQWDKTQYAKGETATVTFSIAELNWDTDDYTYRVEIWDENTEQKTSTLITSRPVSATKTYSIDVGTTFPETGTYYAVLTATDKSSGTEYLLIYDDAYVLLPGSGEVWVQGETYNAVTNSTLGSCTVTATQLGVDHTTTSNATGWYEINTGLVTDWSLGVNASKAGYIGYKMDFTPVAEGIYRVDVPLVPAGGPEPGQSSNATTAYYNSSVDGTAIGGICWEGPYWTLSEGCNITIAGDGWTQSCTTGAGGWYQCNNLPSGGACTLSCNKTGYSTYTKSCTLASGCFNREDCTIEKTSTLTVYCRDLGGSLITGTEVSLDLDTGQSTTTTTGIATFTGLEYGYYTVTADAIGYYPGSTSVVMDSDKSVTVYLQKEGERGAGISYAPKSVEFTVQTIWGKPISECQVNCTGYETTVGPWEWVYQLFGIEENGTPIATSTMSGYTDYKGQINFLMLEPVKYECQFYKPGEINNNLSVYPKSDHYLILATEFGNASWYKGGSDINAMINCTVTTGDGPTSKDRNITLTYSDLTGGTVGGIVYLNQTNTTPGGAEICLSSWSGLTNNCTHTFTVTNCAGQSYFIRVRPNHTTWTFERDFAVSFPPEQVNPLGLTDTELALMSCFLILFVGLLFGGISAPHAPLVMSFLGWIFLALGWLNAIITTAVPALLLASVLSVAYLIMVRSKKERWV